MSSFPYLLSPFEIKGVGFRNRILSTGHETVLVKDGSPSDAMIAYHEARAKGGVGLIVTEATTVHESAFFNMGMPVGYRRECIPGFTRLAQTVKSHGTRIFGQLFHPGSEMLERWPDGSLPVSWAPSSYFHERYFVTSRAMPEDMILSVIAGYATTAANFMEAEYDGVEIVASHGYLPAQFLSDRLNRREDRWGGSEENRQRFLVEIAKAVRAAIPDHAVLGLRISIGEKTEKGMNRDESLNVTKRLQDAGLIDYASITIGSSGSSLANNFVIPTMAKPAGFMSTEIGDVKAQLTLPVMLAGRFNQPHDAERSIADGEADMIGMTRAQICDPELANKVTEGRVDDIRACIACNQACMGHIYHGAGISCIQHPESGRELQYGTRKPINRRRKVLIAGAGPAGMKAAAVAAERGHEVVLCEAAPRLGGQVVLAQLLPERAEFGGVITNLARELELAGVTPRLSTRVDRALIEAEQPDSVVIATGANPYRPEIEGIEDGNVVTAWQVLERQVNCGSRVVVADCTADWIGVGIAQLLAQEGCHVRLVTSAYGPGATLSPHVRDHAIGELRKLGVEIDYNARLFGVDEDTAYFQHTATDEPILVDNMETLVLTYGHRSCDGLADEIRDMGVDLHIIGDALTPRTAEEAILEGLKIAADI